MRFTPDESPREGTRATWQQAAVRAALSASSRFRSVRELEQQLNDQGQRVALPTIYRVLQRLSSTGVIDVLHAPSGEAIYRWCTAEHHHHLVCRVCWQATEISGPSIEQWAREAAQQHSFSDPSHSVEIFGTCINCAGNEPYKTAGHR